MFNCSKLEFASGLKQCTQQFGKLFVQLGLPAFDFVETTLVKIAFFLVETISEFFDILFLIPICRNVRGSVIIMHMGIMVHKGGPAIDGVNGRTDTLS